MSTDAVSEKKGLLHELKDGFSIDLTEEEYLAKEAEIRKIADKLTINMDVLNLLEKDYKLRLLVLSITSYFGFREVTGEELLDAANLVFEVFALQDTPFGTNNFDKYFEFQHRMQFFFLPLHRLEVLLVLENL